MRRFAHFACFDWSGQNVARPQGIALATIGADRTERARLVLPDGGWSRHGALKWIERQIATRADILIGLDLSPTFPYADAGAYFPGWDASPDTPAALWEMVDEICTDAPHLSAQNFVDHSEASRYFRRPGGRTGDRFGTRGLGRLRAVEMRQRDTRQANSASCFNLVGAAQVGKSSLTGMRVLHRLSGRIPFWPFDPVPSCGPVLVEIYTSIAARAAGMAGNRSKIRDRSALVAAMEYLCAKPPARLARYDDHSTDALVTAAWLRNASCDETLWNPARMTEAVACKEGWTFGVF